MLKLKLFLGYYDIATFRHILFLHECLGYYIVIYVFILFGPLWHYVRMLFIYFFFEIGLFIFYCISYP